MGKLILVSISAVSTEERKKDTKANRQYYTGYVVDSENPLTNQAQRNFFQEHSPDGSNAFWAKGITPELIANAIAKAKSEGKLGMELSGEIVRAEVEDYIVENPGREPYKASSYTCIVLKGEQLASVVKAAGHTLKGTQATVRATEQPVAAEMV